MVTRPVFIGGTGKCGTSVMKRCLWRHPEVASQPDELHWLWTFRTDRPGFRPEDFRTDRVHEAIFNADAPWYMDDSPESLIGARYLDDDYRAHALIHMVRHPLDTLDALLAERSPGTYWGRTAKTCAKRIRWIHENAPEHALVVHLRDLAHATEDTLRRVCSHVGLDYTPEMTEAVDPTRPKFGRRQNLTDRQVQVAMPLMRPIMDRYVYAP